jgi:hypothetical protein
MSALAAAGMVTGMAGGIMSAVGDMTQARRIKKTGQNWLDEGKTDIMDSQKLSIKGNIEAMPLIGELTSKANLLSQSEHTKMIQAAMADYGKIRDEQKGLIDKMFNPDALAAETRRYTAGKSLAGGTKGSGFSENLFAREYGRNVTDVLGKKLSALEGYLQSSYAIQKAPEYNFFANSFVTPTQKYTADVEQRQLEVQMRLLASGSPWQGIGKLVSGIGGGLGGMSGMMSPGGSPTSTAGTGEAFH